MQGIKVMKMIGIWALVAVLSRITPYHLPNSTAVGAFAGQGARKYTWWQTLLMVLGVMLVSDAFLTIFQGTLIMPGWISHNEAAGFHKGTWFQYLCVMIQTAYMTGMIDSKSRPVSVVGNTLAAGFLFWVVSDLPIWVMHGFTATQTGVVAALPFLGWQLLGDGLFATAMVVVTQRFELAETQPQLASE